MTFLATFIALSGDKNHRNVKKLQNCESYLRMCSVLIDICQLQCTIVTLYIFKP